MWVRQSSFSAVAQSYKGQQHKNKWLECDGTYLNCWLRSIVLNVWRGTLGFFQDTFRASLRSKQFLYKKTKTKHLTCHLPFSALFFHECPVEFSRGNMRCKVTTNWMQNQIGRSNCLLLSQTQTGFAKCKTMPLFYYCFV